MNWLGFFPFVSEGIWVEGKGGGKTFVFLSSKGKDTGPRIISDQALLNE